MTMEIINVIQGSPEWAAARAMHFCASEAAAALGLSKYTTRAELLRQKATGITPEVSPQQQRIFDAGHEAERAARVHAERIAEKSPHVTESAPLYFTELAPKRH